MGGLTDDADTLPLGEGHRVRLQNGSSVRGVEQPVIVGLLNHGPAANALAGLARGILVLRRGGLSGCGRTRRFPLLAARTTAARSGRVPVAAADRRQHLKLAAEGAQHEPGDQQQFRKKERHQAFAGRRKETVKMSQCLFHPTARVEA